MQGAELIGMESPSPFHDKVTSTEYVQPCHTEAPLLQACAFPLMRCILLHTGLPFLMRCSPHCWATLVEALPGHHNGSEQLLHSQWQG